MQQDSLFQYYLIYERGEVADGFAPREGRVVWATDEGYGPIGQEPAAAQLAALGPGRPGKAPGVDMEAALRRAFAAQGEEVFAQRLRYGPGRLMPSIHRPLWVYDADGRARSARHPSLKVEAPRDEERLTSLQARLKLLLTRLHELLGVVYPSDRQMKTYGHEIAGVLGQAGIEFETECAEILRDNGLKTPRNPKILAYWPLFAPLNLDQPAILLKRFPDIGPITPMVGWTLRKGPAWYKAHHALKQNRLAKLNKATLRSAIDGVASVVVLMVQQFGPDVVAELGLDRFVEVEMRFATPPSELYLVAHEAALRGEGFRPAPLAEVWSDDERIRSLISPRYRAERAA